jgi:putative transport protein
MVTLLKGKIKMEFTLHEINAVIDANQIITLFLCIFFGYLVGKIRIASVSLGGICGTLLAAMVIGIYGGRMDPQFKNILFTLFMFAIGYEGGPQLLSILNRNFLKHLILTIFLCSSSFAVLIICAKIFHLDKGSIAGIAAGALTQSSIVGVANDALSNIGLSAKQLSELSNNIATNFAITYLIGIFVPLLFCINGLELLFKRSIRFDAIAKESELKAQSIEQINGQSTFSRHFSVTVFNNLKLSGVAIGEFEKSHDYLINIYKLKRHNKFVDVYPELVLEAEDEILVFGRSDSIINAKENIGHQADNPKAEWNITLNSYNIVITNRTRFNQTFEDMNNQRCQGLKRGTCLISISRNGKKIPLGDPLYKAKRGDVYEIYGIEEELLKQIANMGQIQAVNKKTDFIFLSCGLVLGVAVGLLKFKLFGITIEVGDLGVLLLGLALGWINYKWHNIAHIPVATVHFIQDFGLTVFIAGVGLNAGKAIVASFMVSGLQTIMIATLVNIIPFSLSYLFGRYILKYNNIAEFGAALIGSRSIGPIFGGFVDKAGNPTPIPYFTVTYALANIVLTIMGSILIYSL